MEKFENAQEAKVIQDYLEEKAKDKKNWVRNWTQIKKDIYFGTIPKPTIPYQPIFKGLVTLKYDKRAADSRR